MFWLRNKKNNFLLCSLILGPETVTQNASFLQCPVCTVYLDKIDLKSKIQYFFLGGDIICDPSIYKMDHPDLIVLNF